MATVLFRLREYDETFRDVFQRAMRAHAEEAYPLLKEIPTEPRSDIHTSQVTLPSGESLKNEPFEMKVPFRFNLSDMVTGDVDAFTASADELARRRRDALLQSIRSPHPETTELADSGLADWTADLPVIALRAM